MENRILICTDLDRTLLPNGNQEESPQARTIFTGLVNRPDVQVAYVSGRHRQLVLDAIEEYQIPFPDFMIGDVGTSIYSIRQGEWSLWQDWHEKIAQSWKGLHRDEIAALFSGVTELTLQEDSKQNTFKVSYYTPPDIDAASLKESMLERLRERGIQASIIWSVDETSDTGLLDVLPAAASKRNAVEYLMQHEGYSLENTVFAGDSGNDLEVLVSPIHSVLVANATGEVREQAVQLAEQSGNEDALYLAQGGFLEMNGNYSAGILEGVAHYIPSVMEWLTG